MLLRWPGGFPPHREDRSRDRRQKFAISQCANFLPHTRFFIRQSIFLKISGYFINTLNRHAFDFQHDRTFTFWVIKDFIFSRIFNFTREYLRNRKNKSNSSAIWLCPPAVKIWSKSVQPFLSYRGDKKTLHTYGRTYERTYLHTAQSTGELRALVTLCLL